jgi:nucleotide-binding universal stress UspA family protein
MAFKSLLTVVGADAGDGDINLAAELCEREQIHLSVLVVAVAPPPPLGEFGGIVAESWIEQRNAEQKTLGDRVAAVSALLAAKAVPADVSGEYEETAILPEAVGRRARYADLTLLGAGLLADTQLKHLVIEGALFHSGRAVLLVPQGAKPTLKPRRVLVGWDSRIEASRAMHAAIDMLASADEVRLALVDPVRDEYHHGDEPGADAAAYLARHGAKVQVDRLPSENRSVADVLVRHASDAGAEMLVMGAYGHSRLRERIFGGVTRSIIDAPPLPVLLAR